MQGSIVERAGARGARFSVVLRGKWYKVPDPQTKRNAELYRAQLVTEIQRGEHVEPKKTTLGEFAARWEEARFAGWSPNTRHGYRTCLDHYLLPRLGRRQLTSLTREDVEQWKAWMLTKYAPSTVQLGLACLRIILSTAVEWRYLRVSPATGVRRPASRRRDVRPLAPDQVRQLLRATTDPQWRALVLMVITGGLRMGEAVATKWQHLDLQGRYYEVRESLVQRAGIKELKAPKSRQSESKVRLSPACCEALQAHRVAQVAHKLARGDYQDSGLIFAKTDGRIWEARMMTEVWWDLLDQADLPRFRFHDLRHTCAALLIDQGAHPKVIQEQMRHTSIRTTFDIYGHLFPQRVEEAVEQIDAALGLAG